MLSTSLLAQDAIDIGKVGESPYEVVTYWAEPFAEKGFALAAPQEYFQTIRAV